jgi:putative spermidine/putrescine transport system permease protein
MRDEGEGKAHWGLVLVAWMSLLFLVLPLAVVIPVSFTPNRYLSLPGEVWSLRHYQALVTDASWRASTFDSTVVALGATGLAVLLGTCCSIGCWRISSRLSDLIRVMMLAPIIVPSIVHALGFYRAWVEFGLFNTYQGLIIAHAIKGIPYVVICVSAALANFDARLEQAARNLGASTGQAIRWVVLPAIMPGILAGAGFAFVTSWDELVVNLFITSRRVVTLPRKIWNSIQDNIDPTVAAMATLLILVTLAGILAHLTIMRGAGRRTARESPG